MRIAAVRPPLGLVLGLALGPALGLALGPALGVARAAAQTPDAAALHHLVAGLTATPRVLVVSTRPGDDDDRLVAWLARGHEIETGVLALTRGESAPDFLGDESGSVLGAVHTQELLQARRIDGAEQFFTHAYDFGFARDTAEVFKRWNRDSIVGDIVSIIRAFRPQVVVIAAGDTTDDGDGQRAALSGLVLDAVEAARTSRAYASSVFGMPWQTSKIYRYGAGLRIHTEDFDRTIGKTYDAMAFDARAQLRSEGLLDLARPMTPVRLQRVVPPRTDSSAAEHSIFDGIDTTLARFAASAPAPVQASLTQIVALADSARRALDLVRPEAALAPLASLASLVSSARAAVPWCAHPARSSAPPPTAPAKSCDQATLDLDASIDLMRQRAVDALLAAAGVEVTATADRELVAESDTAVVTITVTNHGDAPVTLGDVALWGGTPGPATPALIVPSHGSIHTMRTVAGLADPHPWWIASRTQERFPATVPSPLDGVERGELLPANLTVRSGAVPENYRRTSDASVVLTIANATISTSIGPIVYPYADAVVGVQPRPIAGVPDVMLNFGRGLEWIVARKPVTRDLHLFVRSAANEPRAFTPSTPLVPHGLRVDSLPSQVRLSAYEQRDLTVHLRGRSLVDEREALGFVGSAPPHRYIIGYQTIQYPQLPPIRVARSSGLWVQPVDVDVPPTLSVIYVRGIGDDVPAALRQIGVTVVIVPAEDFLTIDISKINTVVLGPRALELHPEIAAQRARLLDYVRNGGTLVVLRGGIPTLQWLPTPSGVLRPSPERITMPDAPVVVDQRGARILTWPNVIRAEDWKDWVSARAELVPSSAGGSKPLEIHDPGQLENRNALLVWHLGKGAFVYTALTLDQQIGAGVPGALRLLVNLLCAGMTPAAMNQTR